MAIVNSVASSVSIARQPIFDDKKRVWGYELFGVGPDGETSVAVGVQASAYTSLKPLTESGRKIVVDFSEASILGALPYALPPNLGAVSVTERTCEQQSVVDALVELQSQGYLIVLDGFSATPNYERLYQCADVIGIDAEPTSKDVLAAGVRAIRKYDALPLAKRLRDRAQFQNAKELGFSLFHGSFFKSPDHVTLRRLSSNEILRFELLQLIERTEPDFAGLTETIQVDATISLRLLAYLNSAAFSLQQNIKSIRQAVALLGWRHIRNWLRVLLLTDMNQSKEARELVLLSAQRGLFLEHVARDHDYWGFDSESLHLLGLFSLLDALLGVPMMEIVTNLPIEQSMKAALCRESNNEYLPLLHLAQSLEEARWSEAESLIQQLNLNSTLVKAAFQASADWSSSLAATL